MIFNIFIVLMTYAISVPAVAKIRVVTTTTNAEALVKAVGGKHIQVESLIKGSQDPHFVEAKPSFIMKVSRADLLVSIGMDLEIGWLPSILRGARKKDVMPGSQGSLILGKFIEPLSIPKGPVSRDHGDVHPEGNPHFMLDPIRVGALAKAVANKLAELDNKNALFYSDSAEKLQNHLKSQTKIWQKEIVKSGQKTIFTYHKTLTYFLKRMGVTAIASVEPKPGVPPTANHILSLIKLAKAKKIKLTLVENYFESSPALRIRKDVPEMIVRTVPVSVNGVSGVTTLDALYEKIVGSLNISKKEY